MNDRFFHAEHTWAKFEGDEVQVGITNFAQEQLGEVAYVDLPEVGDTVEAGESFGGIESIKAVSDLIAPVNGTVIAVNENLEDSPELVNGEPYQGGWMIRVRVEDQSQTKGLHSEEEYLALLG